MTASHQDIRAAIELLGGPSAMARIWNLNVRLAKYYYAGTRDLPPKRLDQLVDALIAHGKAAQALADKLAEGIDR